MSNRARVVPVLALLAAFSLLVSPAPARAESELKNDGFAAGGTAAFQGGFAAGEAAAARFVAAASGRELRRVQLLFGGGTGTHTVTLKVWDDTAGTDAPGPELFTGAFQLTGSDTALHDLDLVGQSIVVTQQFRVGVVLSHGGFPSVAADADGTIAADKNFIYSSPAWAPSSTLGVNGDWVIRAFVSDPGSDAGVASCNADHQCASGTFCELTTHTCTFECRTERDCNGAPCSDRGRCGMEPGSEPDGGCCGAGAGAPWGALALALGALAGITRRRGRRSRGRGSRS